MTQPNIALDTVRERRHSARDYLKELRLAKVAGKRVVITRTREPYRLVDVLREYAVANQSRDTEFRFWDNVNGWQMDQSVADTLIDEIDPDGDRMTHPFAAMEIIHAGVPENRAQNPAGHTETFGGEEQRGIFLMNYMHWFISNNDKRNPKILQLIKEYAVQLPFTGKLLIMTVPENYDIPTEIEHDVYICDFMVPSADERYDIIKQGITDFGQELIDSGHYKELNITQNQFDVSQGDAENIIKNSAGMTTLTIENAVAESCEMCLRRFMDEQTDSIIDIPTFVTMMAKTKTEVVKRSSVLEMMESDNMKNVGGLDNLKKWIGNRKSCFTQQAREYGIETPKGIMLIGPPGTGKSLAAKAIASELDLPLIKFDVSRVFNSLVGQSESNIRSALKMVDSMQPCVLFVDEVDKVFDVSSKGDSGVGQRVLGTFLTWMQETRSQVFVVMTANRVEGLPSEMLRKGRMDELFYVGTPTATENEEIIRIHLRKRGHDPADIGDKGIKEIAEQGVDYVPSEIESAIKEALITSFNNGDELSPDDIINELDKMTPLSTAFRDQFESMEQWARNNARHASSQKRISKKKTQSRSRNRGRSRYSDLTSSKSE